LPFLSPENPLLDFPDIIRHGLSPQKYASSYLFGDTSCGVYWIVKNFYKRNVTGSNVTIAVSHCFSVSETSEQESASH
jgi:hypothetical protein